MRRLLIALLVSALAATSLVGAASADAPVQLDEVHVSYWTGQVTVEPNAYTHPVSVADSTFYASRYTGAVYFFESGTTNPYMIELADGAEVCVNSYTGRIRYPLAGGCTSNENAALL